MSDSFIQVPQDQSGKRVETEAITRPDGTVVQRQRMTVGVDDGNVLTELTLLNQIVQEIRDLKWSLLNALK